MAAKESAGNKDGLFFFFKDRLSTGRVDRNSTVRNWPQGLLNTPALRWFLGPAKSCKLSSDLHLNNRGSIASDSRLSSSPEETEGGLYTSESSLGYRVKTLPRSEWKHKEMNGCCCMGRGEVLNVFCWRGHGHAKNPVSQTHGNGHASLWSKYKCLRTV